MTLRLISIVALLIVAGCSTQTPLVREPVRAPAVVAPVLPPVVVVPEVEPAPSPPSAPPESPPVQLSPGKPVPATPVSSLLASVQSAVSAGNLDRGAALSERALRISPRDAQLWYLLALIRYRQHRIDESVDTAKRALSLAAKDSVMHQQIVELLQELTVKGPLPPK